MTCLTPDALAAGMQYPDSTASVGDVLVFNYMRMHDVRASRFRSRYVTGD